jgi:hypothetical protein
LLVFAKWWHGINMMIFVAEQWWRGFSASCIDGHAVATI